MYRFFNNGQSAVAVDPDYAIQDGDTLLDHFPPDPGEVPAWDVTQHQAQANAAIQAQMDHLDGGGQARQIRGAVLAAGLPASDELARLQALDAQVAALRAQLVRTA